MKRVILTSSLLLLWSSTALASNWEKAAEGSSGSVWYIDRDSVKSVAEGYAGTAIKVWVKIDHSADKTEKARESKVLFFFKCDLEQQKYASWIDYDANGRVISSETPTYTAYKPVVPESVASGVMRLVCPQ